MERGIGIYPGCHCVVRACVQSALAVGIGTDGQASFLTVVSLIVRNMVGFERFDSDGAVEHILNDVEGCRQSDFLSAQLQLEAWAVVARFMFYLSRTGFVQGPGPPELYGNGNPWYMITKPQRRCSWKANNDYVFCPSRASALRSANSSSCDLSPNAL